MTTKTHKDLDQELKVLLDEYDVRETTPPADTRAADRLIIGLLALLLLGATIALMMLFVFDTTPESAYVGDWKDTITETTVEPYVGDWKDTIGGTSADTYSGDWKDGIGGTPADTYSGDWKDTIGG